MPVTSSRGSTMPTFRAGVVVVALAAGLLPLAVAGTSSAATGGHGARVGVTRAAGAVSVSPLPARGRGLARAADAQAPADGLLAVWGTRSAMPPGGGAGTVVAIVDSGADLQHPSLQGHLWSNPGEVAGNGIDDDRNGYVDDVHGLNVLEPLRAPTDEYGHGTAVAGLVAAGVENGVGATGAAPGARLMIVRILSADGRGDTDQLAEGIAYAVRNGASVINCSVNSDVDSPAVDAAVGAAERAGIPVVAAAGNDGLNLDEHAPTYPAEMDSAAVVSVAATQGPGQLAGFSNYGSRSVDLAAPGLDLASTSPGSSFTTVSGTSASAPLVSATLAHERELRPQATLQELRGALVRGAARRHLPLLEGELDAPATIASLTGAAKAVHVAFTLKLTRAGTARGARVALSARWSTSIPLAASVRVLVRVRSGSRSGRVLSTRRVVLRGTGGTINAAPVPRTRARPCLWLDLRTTGATSAARIRIPARISRC